MNNCTVFTLFITLLYSFVRSFIPKIFFTAHSRKVPAHKHDMNGLISIFKLQICKFGRSCVLPGHLSQIHYLTSKTKAHGLPCVCVSSYGSLPMWTTVYHSNEHPTHSTHAYPGQCRTKAYLPAWHERAKQVFCVS